MAGIEDWYNIPAQKKKPKTIDLLNLAPWQDTSEISARAIIDIYRLDIPMSQEKPCTERKGAGFSSQCGK